MGEVTRILCAVEQGNSQAAEQLLSLVYDELRRLAAQKMAQEKPGQTLSATGLLHEAYLRLFGQPLNDGREPRRWDNRMALALAMFSGGSRFCRSDRT